MSLEGNSKIWFEQIIDTINKEKEFLGKARVGFVILKDEKAQPKLHYLWGTFLKKGESIPTEQSWEYKNIALKEKYLVLSEFLDFIKDLFVEDKFKLLGFDFKIKLNFQQPLKLYSNWNYANIITEYPSLHCYERIEGNALPFNWETVVGADALPAFPNVNEAIFTFMRFPVKDGLYQSLEAAVQILIPDYRAKIEKVRLMEDKVELCIKAPFISEKDLILKAYYKTENERVNLSTKIKKGNASIALKGSFSLLELYLISKKGELIDKKTINSQFFTNDKSIEIEYSKETIENLVKAKENQTIEKKREIGETEKSQLEFLESVTAFSNSEGGVIIIGVDNRGNVVGLYNIEKEKQRIISLIGKKCEPKVDFEIKEAKIDSKNLLLVTIIAGNNKPYFLNEKGFLLRDNDTDRLIKRAEMDEIFNDKQKINQNPYLA